MAVVFEQKNWCLKKPKVCALPIDLHLPVAGKIFTQQF